MARKHQNLSVEVTLTAQSERDDLKRLAAPDGKLPGYSLSDLFRHAINAAFNLSWPVPLYRKPEASLTPCAKSRRKARAAAKSAKRATEDE